MNAKTTITPTTPQTLVEIITARQIALDLTNDQIATAVGYEKTNIFEYVKTGAIRFPFKLIRALAETLEIDPAILLVAALRESAPDVLALIDEVWGLQDITPAERRMIQACRKIANGRQVAPIVFGDTVVALVTV